MPVFDTGGRGRKQCPECEKFVGARASDCPNCDFNFIAYQIDQERSNGRPSSLSADAPDHTTAVLEAPPVVKTYTEGGRGKKQCASCGLYVGNRVSECACGSSDFATGQSSESSEEKVINTYTEGGRGKKQCASCKLFVGAKSKQCACGSTEFVKSNKVTVTAAKKPSNTVNVGSSTGQKPLNVAAKTPKPVQAVQPLEVDDDAGEDDEDIEVNKGRGQKIYKSKASLPINQLISCLFHSAHDRHDRDGEIIIDKPVVIRKTDIEGLLFNAAWGRVVFDLKENLIRIWPGNSFDQPPKYIIEGAIQPEDDE